MGRWPSIRINLMGVLRAALVSACAGALIAAGQIIPL